LDFVVAKLQEFFGVGFSSMLPPQRVILTHL
jgi:hypothetical protein